MNWPRRTLIVVFLLALGMTQVAQARWRGHGWHGNVDIIIGPSLGWTYYPPPYYPPPVYIEQAPAAPPPQNYWYYCTDPQGYYPTIKECPGGWLKVVPQTQPTP